MGYALIIPPASEPVSLDEAKIQCRVDGTEQDDYFTARIKAAREKVESLSGRSLITQTWRADFGCFPCRGQPLRLAHSPVQSVVSVYYYDDQGVNTLLDPSIYKLEKTGQQGRLWLAPDQDWPSIQPQFDAVRITYLAGYGDEAAVPEVARLAMLQMIEHWYDNRGVMAGGPISEIPLAATALIGELTVRSLA